MQKEEQKDEQIQVEEPTIDNQQYTFAPLLLFTSDLYFDKGYSNYNSVEEFFRKIVKTNMLQNVIYEKKNMKYDELLDLVFASRSLIICCIDAHFTALQILDNKTVILYNPQWQWLQIYWEEENSHQIVIDKLMRCKYGDQNHIENNSDYYNGDKMKQFMLKVHKDIGKKDKTSIKPNQLQSLPLKEHLFVNNSNMPEKMSVQLTGNTCYFQAYLFALLCKVGNIQFNQEKKELVVAEADLQKLRETTINICQYLTKFYLDSQNNIRALTNNNIIIDFFRYENSEYFIAIQSYLKKHNIQLDYSQQYMALRKYYTENKLLQIFNQISIEEKMTLTPNSKKLIFAHNKTEIEFQLASHNYYKFRPVNIMDALNGRGIENLKQFSNFNSLRKNILLHYYPLIKPELDKFLSVLSQVQQQSEEFTKYKEYYFMPLFEVGQQELVDLHTYTYFIDLFAIGLEHPQLEEMIKRVNQQLLNDLLFSTSKEQDYQNIQKIEVFLDNKPLYENYLKTFLTIQFLRKYISLGLEWGNDKDINCLTRSLFYTTEIIDNQKYKSSDDFVRDTINKLGYEVMSDYSKRVEGEQTIKQKSMIKIDIGNGYNYSHYNNPLQFINIVDNYWNNQEINYIQIFGKDIRYLISFLCQKIIFSKNHNYLHYGFIETNKERRVEERTQYQSGYVSSYWKSVYQSFDLMVGSNNNNVNPLVSETNKGDNNSVYIVDKIFSYEYMQKIIREMLLSKKKQILKTKDLIINVCMLSLILDFDLYDEFEHLLNLHSLKGNDPKLHDKKQLQINISNMLSELEKKNTDFLARDKIEALIYQCSNAFFVNKEIKQDSEMAKIISKLNSDIGYFQYFLLCKTYLSLCQINKSVELNYYKFKCLNDYKIIIPKSFSVLYSVYFDTITQKYNFYEDEQKFICYDQMRLFDLRDEYPEIQMYSAQFKSQKEIQSMYKFVIFNNGLITCNQDRIIFFIAGNILKLNLNKQNIQDLQQQQMQGEQQGNQKQTNVEISIQQQQQQHQGLTFNEMPVVVSTMYLNDAMPMVPCLKYKDSQDVILLCSQNTNVHIDTFGQFNDNYYGMKQELLQNINIIKIFVDSDDQYQFKSTSLNQILVECKIVLFSPYYLLQIENPLNIISLIDYSIKMRNISMFALLALLLKRVQIHVEYDSEKDKITGPWKDVVKYIKNSQLNSDSHYDKILCEQFFQIDKFYKYPLKQFIDEICLNFVKYQQLINGKAQIIPTEKQKNFLFQLITGDKPFYFSEVGSGKSKVIVPLFCQMFLSENIEFHNYLSKNQKNCLKNTLIIIVPEHLVHDAKKQIFRYCLNIEFKKNIKIYDDIFFLKHKNVDLDRSQWGENQKKIFICSFNQFKKALTDDEICSKFANNYSNNKQHVQLLIDEVDDFLDRDKLVFNICHNKNHDLDSKTVESYYKIASSVYEKKPETDFSSYQNPEYWELLQKKFDALQQEIQEKSKSINKNFGIFNQLTLKHCMSNTQQDIQGYKALIARPYESVNRAMPGSYYSDVERTIYLTFYILMQDMTKYDDLFQQERKFITFEYFNEFIQVIDYDELVYGNEHLCTILESNPLAKAGITKYLYQIILKRMEIQDKSRSVNSIDVIFNFDIKGFTGTPFIDNYPTHQYIEEGIQSNNIPDLIERNFYLHTNDQNLNQQYQQKFVSFQGDNNNIIMHYRDSEFIQSTEQEEEILDQIFEFENLEDFEFNCIVDLAGVFKKLTIHGVKDILLRYNQINKNSQFKYIYHIDQKDGSDRILFLESDNEVPFDQEFYKNLCNNYDKGLAQKVFFFIDNRNVTGKDVPFQLIFKNHYNLPLIFRSIILAHDVDDFSKIWQAMGRSRTMNQTQFCIYKNNIEELQRDAIQFYKQTGLKQQDQNQNSMQMEVQIQDQAIKLKNMQECIISKVLYIQNCDKKVIGNLASAYQTLISIYNLSKNKFYHDNEIINTFILKLQKKILGLIDSHIDTINNRLEKKSNMINIFKLILQDKFRINDELSTVHLDRDMLIDISKNIILSKFEQKIQPNYQNFIRFLQGEQKNNNLNELSYTKQQQKQKQQQTNKNQDSEIMPNLQRKFFLHITPQNYFEYTKINKEQQQQNLHARDDIKYILNYPLFFSPICKIQYKQDNVKKLITVYPTWQFVYSLFISEDYITQDLINDFGKNMKTDIRKLLYDAYSEQETALQQLNSIEEEQNQYMILEEQSYKKNSSGSDSLNIDDCFEIKLKRKLTRLSNPLFTLLCMGKGVFIIGMKNQFSKYDIEQFELHDEVHFISDEIGEILYWNKMKMVDKLEDTPYSLNLYILLEKLTKQELALNVINYYHKNYQLLKQKVNNYNEEKGSGFICWRFIFDQNSQFQISPLKKSISQKNKQSQQKQLDNQMEEE